MTPSATRGSLRIEFCHGFFFWNLILRESAEAFMAQEKGLALEALKYRFVSWYFLAGRPWGTCLTLWRKIRNLVSSWIWNCLHGRQHLSSMPRYQLLAVLILVNVRWLTATKGWYLFLPKAVVLIWIRVCWKGPFLWEVVHKGLVPFSVLASFGIPSSHLCFSLFFSCTSWIFPPRICPPSIPFSGSRCPPQRHVNLTSSKFCPPLSTANL